MTKLILKAVSSPKSAASAAVDQVVGQVDTASGAQRLSISAQANTQYRLVDSKTGQVIKNQTVLRKGKTLQIEVEGKNLVELDNFFPNEASDAAPQAPSATYLVDTSATAEPSYGAVSAQSPAGDMVGESSVMWTPGMPALPLSEPVAFGAQVLSALSGISTAGGVALATSVAVVAGSNLDGTDAAGGAKAVGPKVNGSVFAGPVVGQGLVAGLKVQAFDDKGNSLGTADVKADSSYALELSNPNYKGVLVLKVYDDPNDNLTPKYLDEATGKEKSFDTPLLAVVNYSGDATTAQTVNVTPLSHLAALVAGVGTSSNNTVTVPSNLDKNVVQTANIQVAQKFGLVVDDLTSAEVITSDKNTVNDYGRALALWSQMELSNDKTTSDIADTLKSSITTGNNSDLSTLLQKVDDDNTIAIKNISEDDLKYVSDNLTDTTEPGPPASTNDAVTSSDGSKIFIYFDSLLSKNTAEVSAFKVLLTTLGTNGNADTTSDAVISNVAINGGAVVLTLSPNTRVQEGQKISVSYTDPTENNDLFAVQDATGNDAVSFTAQNVVNKVSANPPVIKVEPGQVFIYAENQTDKDLSFTVALEEGSHNTFRFADTQTQTSKDGLYAITSEGKLFLTSAGLAAGNYSNDFETKFNGGNTMTYMVQAGDVSGYWSDPVEITLKVADDADPPTLSTPRLFTVTEDLSSHLLFDSITFADDDIASLTVTLEVTDGVISGQAATGITVGGTNLARTFTGSVSDLNTYFKTVGNITYTSAANSNGVREISVTVSDGTNNTTSTSTLRIQAVNDAPVAASGSATLAAVAEDTTNPAGATVLSLFSGNFNDSKDAVTNGSSANSLAGVAITANTADAVTQGKWQWQANGSSTWNDIATNGLADATALYLAANSLIRFVPVADYKGTPGGLTARLVESSGNGLTNGNVVDVSANGGSTAFSANSVSLGTSVVDINDAPVVNIPQSFTMNEDTPQLDLVFTGTPFADNENARLTVTLSVTDGSNSATDGSGVTVGGTATARTFTGTADDLNAFFDAGGNITYQAAAHFNGSRILTVTVDDGSNANNTATATSTINITAVNDKPQVIAGRGTVSLAPVTEDATNPAGATVGNLFGPSFTDGLDAVPNGSSANVFAGIGITQVALTASQGTWQYSADGTTGWTDIPVTGPDVPSATNVYYFQASTYLRFKPAADFNGTPGAITAYLIEENNSSLTRFTTVNHDYFSATPVTLTTSVTPVNDAPVASGNVTLAAVNEDTTSPAGALVSTLFASSFSDTADAVTNGSSANTLAGVAITANAATATQGKWQWQANGSSTWNDIATTASLSGAIYVRADAKIRFLPAANFNGSPPALTVKLVDNSPATIGTVNSGITTDTSDLANTQFSTSTITLGTTITAVNDAPVRTAGTPTPIVVNEDSANSTAVSLGLSSLNYGPGGGGDESSQTLTYKITNIPSSITLWKAGGTEQVTANTSLTLAELQGLMYKTVANANNSTTANLSWTVTDNGTSPQTITETLGITITAVNDAPVASGSATLTAVAEDTTNPAGALVSALFSSRFSDVDGNTLAGVAITANAATATQGKWQWQANGTTAWTDVPTTGLTSTAALYLAANTLLRFVPAANFNGTPGALTARLVDSSATGLTNGNSTNVSANGGSTAFSSGTVSLNTSITAVNDAPTLTATPAILTFTEGPGSTQTAAVNVFNSTTINTVESGQNITSLTLTASGLRDGIKDVVVIDGTVIPITSGANGTTATNGMSYSVSIPGSVATITLTKSQGITVAQAQTLVNSITYQNTVVDNPLVGTRVFTLTQIKDSGGTANGGVDNTTLNIVANINVVAVNDPPTGTVTVSGSVSVGSLLTANNSLADIDGLGTISYKWEVLNGSTWTSVGTGTTYTPVAVDSGKSLRLTASYTDLGGTAESVFNTFTIAPAQPPMVKAVNVFSSAVLLTFDELLAGSSGAPDASAFTLNKYNSSNTATNIVITSVEHPLNAQTNAPINDQFKLDYVNQTLLDSANPYIKLSYADPNTGNDTNALQDSTGNDMPSFNLFVYNLNANTATGTNAVDYIMGGAGNDAITGGQGNDVLWGLDTFSTVTVTDNDTFFWASGDAGTTGAVDIVKDFVAWNSTAGDKLNITSLLAGGYNTSTSVLSQWVTVTTGQTVPGSATANSTKIMIDVDGSGTGNVTQTIWLEGVTLSTTDAAVLKNSGVLIA